MVPAPSRRLGDRGGRIPGQLPRTQRRVAAKQDFSHYGTYDCYYSYSLTDENGAEAGQGSVLFCAPKHFNFIDPQLSAFVDGDEIIVTANAYARSVEIMAGADVLLEDNYFDMDGGVRRVKILRGEVDSVSVRSVYDIR